MADVDRFYRKVLDDERTRPFFAKLDMEAQVRKQVGFMACALDGRGEYHGRDLRSSHPNLVNSLGLTDVHFDRAAFHLRETLAELGVKPELAGDALQIVAGVRAEVRGR